MAESHPEPMFIVAVIGSYAFEQVQGASADQKQVSQSDLVKVHWFFDPPFVAAEWSVVTISGPDEVMRSEPDFRFTAPETYPLGPRASGAAYAFGTLREALDFHAALRMTDEGSGQVSWSSVGVPPEFAATGIELKIIVEMMLADVAEIVRNLDINADAKREVVEALDEWGEAILSLPTIDDPDEFGEVAATAARHRRTAIEKAGAGGAAIARGLVTIINNAALRPYLVATYVAYLAGMGPIDINIDL